MNPQREVRPVPRDEASEHDVEALRLAFQTVIKHATQRFDRLVPMARQITQLVAQLENYVARNPKALPIRCALALAWFRLLDQILSPLNSSTGFEKYWLGERVEKFIELMNQEREIHSWFRGDGNEAMANVRMVREEVVRTLMAAGKTSVVASAVAKVAVPYKGGRPPSKRRLAVEALEMKMRNPLFSWDRIAGVICTCGSATHGHACGERLRQEARLLNKLLRKHGVLPLSLQ